MWSDIQALTPLQIVGLVAGGLLAMVTLGWTSKASLPKLTLFQGFESSATSQLSAFAFPPPADMAIRFAMYRTYGFTDEQSAVGVLIALVARYAAVIAMPLIGLAAVVVTGQGSWTGLAWLLGLGSAFMVVMWLIIRVARSESMAHATGRFLQRAADWIITKFHRTPPADLEQSVVKFGARTGSTIETNGRSLLLSNLSWGLAQRTRNGDGSALLRARSRRHHQRGVLFATGLTMAINMLPIPGKDALAVSWLRPSSESRARRTRRHWARGCFCTGW